MEAKDIIDEMARDKLVETMVDNLMVPQLYRDELIQDTYLILLLYDKEKIEKMYESGELRFFVARIVTNQYHSKTSRFFYNYVRYNRRKNEGDNHITDGIEDPDERI